MHDPLKPLAATAVLAAALLAPAAGWAKPHPRPHRAWATINVCDPATRSVGVRAFVPRRDGAPAQWVRVRLQYWEDAARAWRTVTSGADSGWVKLGAGRRDVTGGTTFTFDEPAAGRRIVLRGKVGVEWRRKRKVVGRRTLTTTGGHEDPHDPALKVSQRSCEIARPA